MICTKFLHSLHYTVKHMYEYYAQIAQYYGKVYFVIIVQSEIVRCRFFSLSYWGIVAFSAVLRKRIK